MITAILAGSGGGHEFARLTGPWCRSRRAVESRTTRAYVEVIREAILGRRGLDGFPWR